MPTQFRLPTPPGGAEEINAEVAIVRERGQVAYFAAGVPVFVHADGDPVGRRVAAAQLLELGLAQPHELSAALHVHRSTLYRQQCKLKTDGVTLDLAPGFVATAVTGLCDTTLGFQNA